MKQQNIILIGSPVDSGKRMRGCLMGPDAFRASGLVEALEDLGHHVEDRGNLTPGIPKGGFGASTVHALGETIGWTNSLADAASREATNGVPVFLGGDHALSLGSVSGMARYASAIGRKLFVLWFDAHSDFHSPATTDSGHLHGTPVAYFTGRKGFDAFPTLQAPVPTDHVGMIGLRSVDRAEREALEQLNISITDMRRLDEQGIAAPLIEFLTRVRDENGLLHVSLDVDFLDPSIAPAVGTTVPGGATVREAHLAMEILHESGLVSSLDLVELNPLLDDRGKTARLMIDLAASIFGKKTFERPSWN